MMNTDLIQFLWNSADEALTKAQLASPEIQTCLLAEGEELLSLFASV